jgi:predicted GNAT family N-acyltransferase
MEVRMAADPDEVERAIELRIRVFCDEQGVDPAAERDHHDHDALHLVAVEDDRIVGTCRVLMEGELAWIGRMVVDAERRGSGVGAALLQAGERAARGAGARRVSLHAQVAAQGFYERGGYTARGEHFVEEGIDHVTMERPLA